MVKITRERVTSKFKWNNWNPCHVLTIKNRSVGGAYEVSDLRFSRYYWHFSFRPLLYVHGFIEFNIASVIAHNSTTTKDPSFNKAREY
jgi:hypothetical protein